MALHPLVALHLNEIRAISAEYGVETLEVFGSAMTDAFDPARSDVDFIVHYPDGYEYGPFLARYQDFEDALAAALGRPAQIVMTGALRNPGFREQANQTRLVIYDSRGTTAETQRYRDPLPVHSR